MKKLILLSLLCLCYCRSALATDRTTNCTQAAIQNAINASAATGDRVLVQGPCTASWSSAITIPSTTGVAVLTTGGTVTVSAFGFQLTQGSATSSISGFTFTFASNVNCGFGSAEAPIQISGAPGNAAFRLYNNMFTSTNQVVEICVSGNGPGLIDHNSFTVGGASEVIHDLGGGSWNDDVVPGSLNMLIVENNVFTNAASGNPIVSSEEVYFNGQMTFRFNALHGAQNDIHDGDNSGSGGGRWSEIYQNTYDAGVIGTNFCCFIQFRGGSGLFYNNHVASPNPKPATTQFGPDCPSSDTCSGTWIVLNQVGAGRGGTSHSPAYIWGNDSGMAPGLGPSTVPYVIGGTAPVDATNCSGHPGNVCDYVVTATQPATLLECQSAAGCPSGTPTAVSYTAAVYPHPLDNCPTATVGVVAGGCSGVTPPATPGFVSEAGKNSTLSVAMAATNVPSTIPSATCPSFSYCLNFAESGLSGNLGIVPIEYTNTAAITPTVSDGTNTWNCLASSAASGSNRLSLCYASNLAGSPHKVTVGFPGAAAGTCGATNVVCNVQANVAQFNNIAIPPSTILRTSGSVAGTSNTAMTGPALTVIVGDLVYAMFCRTGSPLVMTSGSFVPGAGFTLGLTKYQDGCATEWQVATTTSVTPTMTMGSASSYIVYAAAFIPSTGSQGTTPNAPYLQRVMSWSSQSGTPAASTKFQVVNGTGDLLVMMGAGAQNYLGNSITDSGSNIWTLAGQCLISGSCSSSGGYSYEFYNTSAAVNTTNTQTVNFTGSGDTTIFFYDFVGSFTFNTRGTCCSTGGGNNTSTLLPATPISFNPLSTNSLTIATGPIAFNTAVTVALPSSGTSFFDGGFFGGEPINGGTVPESIIDQNNIWSHTYESVSGAQNWQWNTAVNTTESNDVGVDFVSFNTGAPVSNTAITITADGAGSSHVGTAMATALSYTNPGSSALGTTITYPGTSCTTSGTNVCYSGSTLTVTGSLCTSGSPCTWTLKDQNGDSINASELTLAPSPELASPTVGTYTSGITATGSTGQTCTLTGFNNNAGLDALATVALTGTNTIATGKALAILTQGLFSSAPTTAVVSNGTATCTGTGPGGTATISTTVRGPMTPLGQIDCSGSAANTTCFYNAPLNYPSTQVVNISVTDGTTTGTATVGFAYLNNLNEYFTHRGRTVSNPCPFSICTITAINNMPWNIYAKVTTPVTYQPLIITFQNTVATGLEASILSMTSDPGYGILMPASPGSGINRPTMSYNGKWIEWVWDTPQPGGGFTSAKEMFQQSNGSALQRQTCDGTLTGNTAPEKNHPNWFITNDGTSLQVCDMDNAQAVTNVATHGLPTVGSNIPHGFSYEAGPNDSVYALRTEAPSTGCSPITTACSLTFAAFDLTNCYASLSASCATQLAGSPWSSFVNGTGIGGPPGVGSNPLYGWEAGGAIHCSNPRLISTDIPAPNCEWHIHDIWFVPKTTILSIDYGPFGSGGEAIQYAMPAGGGAFDNTLCATPPTWPNVTTVTCLSPNTATNIPFFSHPAFNQAQNNIVTYAGAQNCNTSGPQVTPHTCLNFALGNGITNLNTNLSTYFTTNSYGHAAWDGYDTNHFGHDTTVGNTGDITFACNTQTLREVNVSAVTDVPLGYFGCRPIGSSGGGAGSYTLSPVQSSDGTRLFYSMDNSAKSGEPGAGNNIDNFLLLGWVFQTRASAVPTTVVLGTPGAKVQWTGAPLNRETQLYWVYKQPSCTGAWTRLASVTPSNWTTTGYTQATNSYTDGTLGAGSNACYGVTSQEWAGSESASLSNTIKITNTGGVFSSTAVSGPGTTFSVAAPADVTGLAIAQKLVCATNCASANTPTKPTVQAVAGGSLATTYFAMIVYGKCIDFPNCTNFKGTLPSLASTSVTFSNPNQTAKIFGFNTEMVGQDAVQFYMSTTATPASGFHLQTPVSCTPATTVVNSTVVLMNNFNLGSSNSSSCTFPTFNASGAAPPVSNTAVGGYQISWTDPGGAANRYEQIYYREGAAVPLVSELTAQQYLIATPPVGTQSFYDAFPNQALSAANIHYGITVKNMDGTRSPGVCMTGAGVIETCAGASGNPTATLSPNLLFGNQNVGTTSSPLTATLANTGSVSVNVTSSSLVGAGFANTGTGSCSNGAFTLLANTQCTFIFTFTPTSATTFNGTFTVNSNAPQVSITLSGTGVQSTSTLLPSTLAFGNEYTSVTTTGLTTSLTNTGAGPINVTGVVQSGSSTFVNTGTGTCGTPPFTLNAGNSCTFVFTFGPIALGPVSGTLTVTSNASTSPQVVTLTGTGIPVQPITGSGSISGQGSLVVHP